jgi:hypothetical protein
MRRLRGRKSVRKQTQKIWATYLIRGTSPGSPSPSQHMILAQLFHSSFDGGLPSNVSKKGENLERKCIRKVLKKIWATYLIRRIPQHMISTPLAIMPMPSATHLLSFHTPD